MCSLIMKYVSEEAVRMFLLHFPVCFESVVDSWMYNHLFKFDETTDYVRVKDQWWMFSI